MSRETNRGESGIYDFLSHFGCAGSNHGGYQNQFSRLDLLICIKTKSLNLCFLVSNP